MSFLTVLTLILVVLKLVGLVSFSWLAVFTPALIEAGAVLILIAVYGAVTRGR